MSVVARALWTACRLAESMSGEVYDRFRPAVYGIAFNRRGQVLLCYNNTRGNFFNFPGGGIESGEAPVDALKREFMEETGLEILPVQLIWATQGRHMNWFRPNQQLLGQYYLVDVVGGKLKRYGNSDDVKKCVWVDVDKLPVESMSPFDREIADILKMLFQGVGE